MSRNPTCIFHELEQLQYAMIVMQNSLSAHKHQEMVQSITDNFCDLIRNTEFPNTTEKIFFSELLITDRRDRDNGLDIDLNGFLDQIVDVFKQDDGPQETLQAALMAVNHPNDEYRQEHWARNGSGGRVAIVVWSLQ